MCWKLGMVWLMVMMMGAVARGMGPVILPPQAQWANGPMEEGDFEGPGYYYGRYRTVTAEQLRQQIDAILDLDRSPGMDDWAWHSAVEDQLVALGEREARAVPLIWQAAEMGRKGFEQDALEVAAFRLENPGVNPRQTVAEWAKNYPAQMVTPRGGREVARVMGLMNLFPHHLFYTVETAVGGKTMRVVLAVAADSKVQVVSDDVSLARFMRVELPPLSSPAARENAKETAALLALARLANVYQAQQVTEADGQTWQGETGGHRVKTRVTFDDRGRVAAVNVSEETVAMPESIPVTAPNPAAPPAMPD